MDPITQNPTATVHSEPTPIRSHDDFNRCQYRFANNKRCRLPGSKTHLGFCPHHFNLNNQRASQQSFNDSEDLSSELLPELSRLNPAVNMKQFLARLLALVT